MTELARPDPSWLAYIAPRCLPSTPLRARVAWALLADPRRSNRVLAREVGADHDTVRRVRLGLEDMGVIPVYRASSGTPGLRYAPVRDRVSAALLADPYRTNRAVAAETGTCYPVVIRARHMLERDGRIPVYRAPTRPARDVA